MVEPLPKCTCLRAHATHGKALHLASVGGSSPRSRTTSMSGHTGWWFTLFLGCDRIVMVVVST